LMAKADLAIAAGGSTAWELAYMGLPALVLILAENQRANAERLGEAGIAENLGLASTAMPEVLAEQIKKLASDPDRRVAMSQNGRALVDGFGNMRVWFRLNETALRLRRANSADARFVWESANESTVRDVSFSSDPIRWEDHLIWFEKKISDPNCFLWIAADDSDIPLGMARFDLEGEIAVISVSLDKNRRGKNRGSLLIWLACRKLFLESNAEIVDAFIKSDNHASIRAFQKAGLEQSAETTVKNQPALRFQIKRKRLET
ncbi:MAG: GNAT family N-acetyltransferase, partial [Verrucomicrobiota bacterium]